MRERTHPDERTDEEILAVASSDPSAFLLIFERHSAAVHRFVVRQLGPAEAEDATADVFLEALRSAKRFRPQTPNALPWLLGIATNVVRARLRQRYAGRQEPLEPGMRSAIRGSDDSQLDAIARLTDVQRALASLSIEQREALLMFSWMDLTYEEIAVALALPIGTVRSRISRARRQLRQALGLGEWEVLSEAT